MRERGGAFFHSSIRSSRGTEFACSRLPRHATPPSTRAISMFGPRQFAGRAWSCPCQTEHGQLLA